MYDIEGWINNEGSGDAGFQEPANYLPGGYNADWDAPEHFSYEPGTNLESTTTPTVGNISTGVSGFSPSPSSSSWSPTSFGTNKNTESGVMSGGSSSSSGGRYIPPTLTGRTRTSTYLNTKPLPMFNAPSYSSPAYDIGRVNYLSGQQFAPMVTRGREALYTNIGKIAATDNPYMQLKNRKAAMEGYGGILSEGQAAATRIGTGLYNTEYAGKVGEAKANFNAQMASNQAMFEAALKEWMQSGTTTDTEQLSYNGEPLPKAPTTGGYLGMGMDYEDYIKSGEYMNTKSNDILVSRFYR